MRWKFYCHNIILYNKILFHNIRCLLYLITGLQYDTQEFFIAENKEYQTRQFLLNFENIRILFIRIKM